MKSVLLLISVFLIVGCVHQPTETQFFDASERPDLAHFVTKADITAEEILYEFNNSECSKELGEGPFHLKEYTRHVAEDTYSCEQRPIVIVFYELQKPVTFFGHPQHFQVWIYKDTGETEWFGGE